MEALEGEARQWEERQAATLRSEAGGLLAVLQSKHAAAVAALGLGAGRAAELEEEVRQLAQQVQRMQRQLSAAHQRLGAAQSWAAERRQQLNEYLALAGGDSKSIGGGSQGAPEDRHVAAAAAVCDRCRQAISPEAFKDNADRLEAAVSEAESATAAAQEEVEAVSQLQDLAVRLQQVQQEHRLLQGQLDALSALAGSDLETAAAALRKLCGNVVQAGSNSEEEEPPSEAGVEEALEAASSAARDALAAAENLQQRWQGQQLNLSARDAALVGQQVTALEQKIAEAEQQQAKLEGEVELWKMVSARC